jgi:hypothetical protein
MNDSYYGVCDQTRKIVQIGDRPYLAALHHRSYATQPLLRDALIEEYGDADEGMRLSHELMRAGMSFRVIDNFVNPADYMNYLVVGSLNRAASIVGWMFGEYLIARR